MGYSFLSKRLRIFFALSLVINFVSFSFASLFSSKMSYNINCPVQSHSFIGKEKRSTSSINIFQHPILKYRGGENKNEINSNNNNKSKWSLKQNLLKNILGLWGVLQVVSILANAIKRLVPIALQPIIQKDILPIHWVMYVSWAVYMTYTEGYKAFQQKFSPLVVQRAFGLINNPSIINYILAGPYSMGLFGATRKRMIISWSITAGVFSLVKLVKLLPYPYRSIIDAGVVAGLSYGTLSICVLTIKKLFGGKIDSDEALPPPADKK